MANNGHIQDKPYQEELRRFLAAHYDMEADSISPAKRGYYGETWRLSGKNSACFVKLDASPRHRIYYRNSLSVMDYLCRSGVDCIGRVIKNREGALYTGFRSAILGVFAWLDGDTVETDETKAAEYRILGKIYALTKEGFTIPSAVFSDEAARDFFAEWERAAVHPSGEGEALLAVLESRRDMLEHHAARLRRFAEICAGDPSGFVFTHGDAGGNLLACGNDYHIIDWDEVMYAPPERDAWVMGCYAWARDLFQDALRQSGISYQLRPERLAFYAYHMFFHYLGELFRDGKWEEIEGYFDSWIAERIRFADGIPL